MLTYADVCSLKLQTQTDTNGFRTWVHYSTYDSVCTYYLYYMLRKELELTGMLLTYADVC